MGPSVEKGKLFYAGPAVMFPPGTVLIVLAHRKKAFTVHIRPGTGHTLTECIEETVNYARELAGEGAKKWTAEMLGHTIEVLVEKYGRVPSSDGSAAELTNEHNIRILGMLFMPMPAVERTKLADTFEKIIARGICPALIGLLGKGTVKGLSMAWPLPLALAPYADAVLAHD